MDGKNSGWLAAWGGGIGALLGTMVAFALHFRGWWVAPVALISAALGACIVVRPMEVWGVARDTFNGIPEKLRANWHGILGVFLLAVGVVVCTLCWKLSLWLGSQYDSSTAILYSVVLSIAGLFAFAITGLFASHEHSLAYSAAELLSRSKLVLFNELSNDHPDDWGDKTVEIFFSGAIFLVFGGFLTGFVGFLVPVATSLFIIVCLPLDIVRVLGTGLLNTLLRVAVNDRLAAMEGAVLGAGFSLLYHWGTETPAPLLVTAILLGAGFGHGIFLWRKRRVEKLGDFVLAY